MKIDASKETPLAQDMTAPAYPGASNSIGSVSLSQLISSDGTRQIIATKFLEVGYKLSDFQINTVMNRSMSLHDIFSDLKQEWAYSSHLKNEDASQYVEELKKMECLQTCFSKRLYGHLSRCIWKKPWKLAGADRDHRCKRCCSLSKIINGTI